VNVLHEVNPDAIEFIEAGGNIRAYSLLRPYYVPLVFNLRHKTLQRKAVRVALAEAIDREEIVDRGLNGHGQVAQGPVWPHHWAHPLGLSPPRHNPEAARVRLDAAGLPVRERTTPQMPSRFAFRCMIPADDIRFERIALVVQRQLFAIGIDMQVDPLPRRQLEERMMAGDFEASLFDLVASRSLAWAYKFWHSPAPGTTPLLSNGYSGADGALDRMRLASSDEEVRIAVADVMRVLREDPPAVFLVWRHEARAVDKSIDVPHQPERDIFGTLWQSTRARLTGD
jgi:ABC-type transport system substrate-binding protein